SSEEQVVLEELVLSLPAAGFVQGLCRSIRDAGVQREAFRTGLAGVLSRAFEQRSSDATATHSGADEEVVQDPKAHHRDRREGWIQLGEPRGFRRLGVCKKDHRLVALDPLAQELARRRRIRARAVEETVRIEQRDEVIELTAPGP